MQQYSGDSSLAFFENTQIKEVGRMLDSSGNAYMLVQEHLKMEDMILKKEESPVMLVSESVLDESAIQFLRSYMPSNNSAEALVQRMDQEAGTRQGFMAELEIQMSQISEEKNKILQDYEQVTEQTGIVLKSQNTEILKENLQIREKNHSLLLENTGQAQRLRELNAFVTQMISEGHQDQNQKSNPNEQQISYGKKTESLLGSAPIIGERASVVTFQDVDLSRQDSDNSGGDRIDETVVTHVKSNLKVYLMKTPIISFSNEIILKVIFSLLNFSKEEVL